MGLPEDNRTLADLWGPGAAQTVLPIAGSDTSSFRSPEVIDLTVIDLTVIDLTDGGPEAAVAPSGPRHARVPAAAGLPYAVDDEEDPRRSRARLVLGSASLVVGIFLIVLGAGMVRSGGDDDAPAAVALPDSSTTTVRTTSSTARATSSTVGPPPTLLALAADPGTEVAGVTITTVRRPAPATARPVVRPKPGTDLMPDTSPPNTAPPVTTPQSTDPPTTEPPTTEPPTTTTEPPTTTTEPPTTTTEPPTTTTDTTLPEDPPDP